MLRIRQYLCRHKFRKIALHRECSESLSKCNKCRVYKITHDGIGTSYLSKTPHISAWEELI